LSCLEVASDGRQDPLGLLSANEWLGVFWDAGKQTAKDSAKVAAKGAAGVVVGAGVVGIAAVSAPIVIAGAAAAAITYGAVKATEAGINRWGNGQSVAQAAIGGAADVTGVSSYVAGVADLDIATGQRLNLTHDQKVKALGDASFALGALYGGAKTAEAMDFSSVNAATRHGINEALASPASARLGTAPGQAFFWSGRTAGIGGEEVAAGYAGRGAGVTLEQVLAQRGIPRPTTPEGWTRVSREFAQGASGDVRAVVGRSLRPGNQWETTELPVLKSNPNVASITTIDPATGVPTVIYTRP
jgi:hypothetical protein